MIGNVVVRSGEGINLHGGGSAVEQKLHDLHSVAAHLHFVDGPIICGGVVDPDALPGFAAEEPVEGQSGGLAENVELRHVDRAEGANFRAAGVPHSRLEIQVAPDAIDVPRVPADQASRLLLERADFAAGIRVGFARPHDALVGVQPHPPELGAVGAAGAAADVEILAESHRLDPDDLHRLGIIDGREQGRRQRARPYSGHFEKIPSRDHIRTAFLSTYSSTLDRAGGRSST